MPAGERSPARSSDEHRTAPVGLPAAADPVRPLHNAPRSAGAESIERRATGRKAARVPRSRSTIDGLVPRAPSSCRVRCTPLRFEGRVEPGPMGHSALGPTSTWVETRRGLRVPPTSERWTPEIAAVATTPRSAWLPRRRNRGRVRGELRASSPDLPVRPATHALTPC
jgi:hypothetical protein